MQSETVTNGTLEARHYSPLADIARQICSYAEGDARQNVYNAALAALEKLSPATPASPDVAALIERVGALEGALSGAEDAIVEYYRYWTGGETRGSYDGKPERANLWKARQAARQALGSGK